MKSLLAVLAAAPLLAFAACSPPPEEQAENTAPALGHETPDPVPAAVTDAVTAAVAADIGRPVLFDATTLNIDGDWAWVIGMPQNPGATPLDWSTTKYADRAEAGALDGNGTTYALVQRDGGRWIVRDFAIGPTDIAWADWPERYGAPASLLGLPAE